MKAHRPAATITSINTGSGVYGSVTGGTITVDGAGSTLAVAAVLSAGTLNITNGATTSSAATTVDGTATGDGAAVGALPPPAQLRELQDRLARERAENERLRRELEAATQCAPESTPPPPPPAPEDRRPAPQEQFFKRW